ncbi:MAG: uracil-DNA glycosylase family protein [Prevotella sp.]|nr:uracil-DNA glycosylase family protein [Prevotella sp.]
MPAERHPLQPYIPSMARLLMLGSFPPASHRWSMNFFYPNFINDMWRIFGICFKDDKSFFVDEGHKTFRKALIEELLNERGIALYDTATAVERLNNTASDKDLKVVEKTDLKRMLRLMPECRAIATTGQKAAELACECFGVDVPKVGSCSTFTFEDRAVKLYRMPSSSRAYPMKVERKAEFYKGMFADELIL